MNMPILAPAAVLVLWSVFMMYWLMAARLPAMAKIGVDLGKAAPGGRGQDIDPNLPPPVAWKSHNYAHLMEQPTVFYAAVAILAISGGASEMSVYLAWGYTMELGAVVAVFVAAAAGSQRPVDAYWHHI